MGMGFWRKLCRSKYEEIDCDKEPRYRLKNPEDFMKQYAKDWTDTIEVATNGLNDHKVKNTIGNKVVELRKDMDSINRQLELALRANYDVFALRPCDNEAYDRLYKSIHKIVDMTMTLRLFVDNIETAKNFPQVYEQWMQILKFENVPEKTKTTAMEISKYSVEEFLNAIVNDANTKLSDLKKKAREL